MVSSAVLLLSLGRDVKGEMTGIVHWACVLRQEWSLFPGTLQWQLLSHS